MEGFSADMAFDGVRRRQILEFFQKEQLFIAASLLKRNFFPLVTLIIVATLADCASSKIAMSSGENRRKSRLPPSSAKTPCS